jgi:hypothetical protein
VVIIGATITTADERRFRTNYQLGRSSCHPDSPRRRQAIGFGRESWASVGWAGQICPMFAVYIFFQGIV